VLGEKYMAGVEPSGHIIDEKLYIDLMRNIFRNWNAKTPHIRTTFGN
jgi:hypothetical protein